MINVDAEKGKQYGCYTIIDFLPIEKHKSRKCVCKCNICGAIRYVGYNHLKDRLYKYCPECDRPKALKNNLIGQKFGRLTVIERAENHKQPNGTSKVQYKCICDCGNECIVQSHHLIKGHTTSCGCAFEESKRNNSNLKDINGQKFGILTAKERVLINGRNYWRCECECGGEKITTVRYLNSGKVTSCGCMVSVGEYKMQQILLSNNIQFKKQYMFEDCRDKRKLPFDFAVFKDDKLWFLIEIQGQQHYYPFTFNNESKEIKRKNLEDRVKKDTIKKEYCEANGIPLLEIRYTMFDKLEEILKTFISNIENKT